MLNLRIGLGIDIHPFAEGRKLILGGITIPFEKGLLGHSDADVLTHAIIDAMLGAAALNDIGTHFPDNDEKYRNICSLILLNETHQLLKNMGWEIVNIDATVVTEKPKLQPYIMAIREKLAETLQLSVDQVSVKAKTSERLGFIGKGEGVLALSTVLITKA